MTDQWDEYNARFKALGNWARNAADPFDLALARGQGRRQPWQRSGQGIGSNASGSPIPDHPFRLQGSADLNSYKMFAEVFWNLLQTDGRLGVILPTGIYSDFGTKDLRETLLNQGRIDLLYAFQNEKRVFAAAHHAYKQVALFATKGGKTESFRTRFRMGVGDSPEAHEIPDDLLRNDSAAMVFTPDDVRKNSPKSLSLVELRSQRDLDDLPQDLRPLDPHRRQRPRLGDHLRQRVPHDQRLQALPAAGAVGGEGVQAGCVRAVDWTGGRCCSAFVSRSDDPSLRSVFQQFESGRGRSIGGSVSPTDS